MYTVGNYTDMKYIFTYMAISYFVSVFITYMVGDDIEEQTW